MPHKLATSTHTPTTIRSLIFKFYGGAVVRPKLKFFLLSRVLTWFSVFRLCCGNVRACVCLFVYVRACRSPFDMNEIIQAYDAYAYWTEMELNAIMIARGFIEKGIKNSAPNKKNDVDRNRGTHTYTPQRSMYKVCFGRQSQNHCHTRKVVMRMHTPLKRKK